MCIAIVLFNSYERSELTFIYTSSFTSKISVMNDSGLLKLYFCSVIPLCSFHFLPSFPPIHLQYISNYKKWR